MRRIIKKGILTAAFAAVTGGTFAVAGTTLIPYVLTGMLTGSLIPSRRKKPKVSGVPLTEGEITFAKSVFGNKIDDADLKKIRKYFRTRKEGKGAAAAVLSMKQVDFYGTDIHTDDYSKTQTASNFSTFIHEMTHIWQRSRWTPRFFQRVRKTRKYDYTLTSKSRFKKFGHEQQASIIGDYALRFLFPHGDVPARHLADTPASDALLQKVVEKEFPEARKSRLALAEKKKEQTYREPRLKFLFNVASGVTDQLDKLQKAPGSKFEYMAIPSGNILFISTNILIDGPRKDARLEVIVLNDGHVTVQGTPILTTRENIAPVIDYVAEKAAEKGLIKKKPKALAA